MTEPVLPSVPQRYCEYCGGELDIRLNRRQSGSGQQSVDTTCTKCGRESGYSWASLVRTASDESAVAQHHDPMVEAGLAARRNFRRRRAAFMSGPGQVDIQLFIEAAGFPVYGLKGRPQDLRLRSIGSGGSIRKEIERVDLTYKLGDPNNPDAAVQLIESEDDPYLHVKEGYFEAARTEREFSVVQQTVLSNSSSEQTKRWFHAGDFNRLWNMETAARASRDDLEVEIAGATRSVDAATWKEPFKVAVFTFALDPTNVIACSLSLPRQDTVECLRQLADLAVSPDVRSEHQADFSESRRLNRLDR